ncbi:MAG: phenylalanine--tRNA ligase subunit alpha [Pseudomonadota bacterium]
MKRIPEIDYKVLAALASKSESIALPQLAEEIGLDQSQVAAVCTNRMASGEIQIQEQSVLELRLGNKGKLLAGSPLPERLVIEALSKTKGQADIGELPNLTSLEQKEIGQSLRWLKQKKWAEKTGKQLQLLPAGQDALKKQGADELLLSTIAKVEKTDRTALRASGLDVEAGLALLDGRSGLVEEKERKIRFVSLTEAGRNLVKEGLQPRKQINQLTSDLLRSGEWRDADLRPYDITLASQPVYPGKEHPLVSIFEQTRRVFLELGFTEISSPYVESSFWDFDALFQPQDHPARDMQDTFYVARPNQCQLPNESLVERIRSTHEDGGDTGSIGWRYKWNRELARRPVLRTHTTASTIRALARDPKPPQKVFCVGPVFRRETVDYKHLPVFHQVDGIIVDDKAAFAHLLGTLQAFYRKMGFDRFQFRPAFFPYTEPSVEIFVWSEKKNDWVEMGGAGMFRPEVTEPFGCTVPVLAWGLGLERLAMFRYQLGSISELYRARMTWLKETPLCR